MVTLTNEFQYLGRSEKLSPKSGSYGYYILLYGKTTADEKSGIHTVTIQERIACTINSSFYNFSSTYSGSVHGVEVFAGKKAPSAAWTLGEFTEEGITYKIGTVIAEGSKMVDASDGLAKEVVLSCSWTKVGEADANYVPSDGVTGAVLVTVSLPAIKRASEVSASDAYIGSTSIITVLNPLSGYGYRLSYRFAGEEDSEEWYEIDYIEYPSTTYIWRVPEEIYERIPNSKSISCVIVCETLKGGDVLGVTESSPILLSVNESVSAPFISFSASVYGDTSSNSITGSDKRIIKGYSTVIGTVGAEAKNNASISTISASLVGSPTRTSSNAQVLFLFEKAQSNQLTIKANDSRGISTTVSATDLELVEYIPLTAVAQVTRESPTSDTFLLTVDGNLYQGVFNPDGGSANDVSIKVLARPYGSAEAFTEIGDASVTKDGASSYRASYTGTGYSYNQMYEIQIVASDAISTVTKTAILQKGTPIFDWSDEDFRIHMPLLVEKGRVYGEHLLFSGNSASTVTLNDSIDNYEYVDIYYHDNNGRDAGVERLYNLNGAEKIIHLSLTEASTATTSHIRRTEYTCTGNTLTPDVSSAGYLYFSGTTVKHTTGTNYIRIARVVGYK